MEGEVKQGIVSHHDLQRLSVKIADRWKPLGRRLKITEVELTTFDFDNEEYSEKAYRMLLRWKERDGSAATYLVLYTALCHHFVNRVDLAEEFCIQIYGHTPRGVKEGIVSEDDLERLSLDIAPSWKPLGRRLRITEEQLLAFDFHHEEYSEKAYVMLLHWKRLKGSAATYLDLYTALCHDLVGRRDLAEEFCIQIYGHTPRGVKQGIVSDHELDRISVKIAERWKPLGRRLGITEAKLLAFDKENKEYSEKAFRMLLYWKEMKGSAATYLDLYDALCHDLVVRRDLAEEFCIQISGHAPRGDESVFKSRKMSDKSSMQKSEQTTVEVLESEVKQGTPTCEEIEELGEKIGYNWKKLGRRLGIDDETVEEINQAHQELSEKGYHLLKLWKLKQGSAATYQALSVALKHVLVRREDLAELFCYIKDDESVFKSRKLSDKSSMQKSEQTTVKVLESEVKVGSPSDDELEKLSFALTGEWKQLGRLLQLKDSILRALDAEPLMLTDKAQRMLMYWKEKEGSNATYQVLSDALRHEFVRRDDLAETFCDDGSERGPSEAVLYSKLRRNAQPEEKMYFPDVKLETKSESKVKVEPSDEELDINKMETELSGTELDTKEESKIKVEPSDAELDTKPENTIKIEPSGKGLNTKTGSKAEFPDVDMDTESESKMEIEMSGEGPDSMSDNSMKTMLNVDLEQCEISDKGAVWKLQDIHAAACITFPPNALRETVWFRCTRKEPTIHSPPLKKDEALVSNVIELSYHDSPTSSFTGNFEEKVLVDISHSAANLKGYEVVIRELVDTYNHEWKDLETTNKWQASEIKGDVSKPTPPFAEAHVTCCSTFAVVCRLKSYTYSARNLENCDFLCAVQDYPDVSVTIPASVVHAQKELQLTLKVQEIPHQWFNKTEIIVGPVLHVTCSHNLELLGKATITIPISLQADRREFSSRNVKVLVSSDEETSDWKDITRQLPSPAEVTNGVVTFEVTHFSRFHVLVEKQKRKRRMQKLRLDWHKQITRPVPAQQAGFSACLCNAESHENNQFVLIYCCYPIHLVSEVKNEVHSGHEVLFHNDGNSLDLLSENDEIRVALEGLNSSTKDLRVRFLGVINFKASAPVRRDPQYGVPEVIFTRDIGGKRTKLLCRLALTPPASTTTTQSQTVKDGIAKKKDLQKLSQRIADGWKWLGRCLRIKEAKLTAFDSENYVHSEKAYKMLLYWKQREGSKATYRVLHDALVDSLVDRRDLAEDICSG